MSWSASFLSIGSPVLNTDSRLTMHLVTSGMEGTSNITRFITFSMIARKPRAPVFRCNASSAISSNASSVKVILHHQGIEFFHIVLLMHF